MSSNTIQYSETRDLPLASVLSLYRANEWSSAEKAELLQKALVASHSLITAWDGSKLVGLSRGLVCESSNPQEIGFFAFGGERTTGGLNRRKRRARSRTRSSGCSVSSCGIGSLRSIARITRRSFYPCPSVPSAVSFFAPWQGRPSRLTWRDWAGDFLRC